MIPSTLHWPEHQQELSTKQLPGPWSPSGDIPSFGCGFFTGIDYLMRTGRFWWFTRRQTVSVGRRQNVGEIESGSSPRTVSNNAGAHLRCGQSWDWAVVLQTYEASWVIKFYSGSSKFNCDSTWLTNTPWLTSLGSYSTKNVKSLLKWYQRKEPKFPSCLGKLWMGKLGHPRPLEQVDAQKNGKTKIEQKVVLVCAFKYKLKCSLLEMYCNTIRLHVNRNVMECAKTAFHWC